MRFIGNSAIMFMDVFIKNDHGKHPRDYDVKKKKTNVIPTAAVISIYTVSA